MTKELHVLSISGGKDSAALAVYLKEKYPYREFKYLFFDTGEELQDTYDYLVDPEKPKIPQLTACFLLE